MSRPPQLPFQALSFPIVLTSLSISSHRRAASGSQILAKHKALHALHAALCPQIA